MTAHGSEVALELVVHALSTEERLQRDDLGIGLTRIERQSRRWSGSWPSWC